jgi:hypothetical protein
LAVSSVKLICRVIPSGRQGSPIHSQDEEPKPQLGNIVIARRPRRFYLDRPHTTRDTVMAFQVPFHRLITEHPDEPVVAGVVVQLNPILCLHLRDRADIGKYPTPRPSMLMAGSWADFWSGPSGSGPAVGR